MKTHRYRLLLGIVSIVVLSSCRLFVKEPTLDPTFDNLGVDTDLGARLDANGNLIPDGVNPLGAGAGAIDPLDEIYVAGIGYNSKNNALFNDVSSGGLRAMMQESAAPWASDEPKKAIGADVDGDGLDWPVDVELSLEQGIETFWVSGRYG